MTSDEYNEAVGAVMAARRQYEAMCEGQGAESWAAEQARDYLQRQIDHRDEMRKRHDAAPDAPRQAPR